MPVRPRRRLRAPTAPLAFLVVAALACRAGTSPETPGPAGPESVRAEGADRAEPEPPLVVDPGPPFPARPGEPEAETPEVAPDEPDPARVVAEQGDLLLWRAGRTPLAGLPAALAAERAREGEDAFALLRVWDAEDDAHRAAWRALLARRLRAGEGDERWTCAARVAGRPGWWLILLFVPIVSIIVWAVICSDISKSFGRGIGSTICMVSVLTTVSPLSGTRPTSISHIMMPSA